MQSKQEHSLSFKLIKRTFKAAVHNVIFYPIYYIVFAIKACNQFEIQR